MGLDFLFADYHYVDSIGYKELPDMRKELSDDETELFALTDSTLKKLSAMTDEDYDKPELYPDFDD